ncbi:putative Oil body-associated protein [Helianthus debilis subsp. tardiflorus]
MLHFLVFYMYIKSILMNNTSYNSFQASHIIHRFDIHYSGYLLRDACSVLVESATRLHLYADDMTGQVEAHHYCGHLSEEMRQCLIYNRPDVDARLIGLKYKVTKELFLVIQDTEKPMWHSHEYEVTSSVLFLPGFGSPG